MSRVRKITATFDKEVRGPRQRNTEQNPVSKTEKYFMDKMKMILQLAFLCLEASILRRVR